MGPFAEKNISKPSVMGSQVKDYILNQQTKQLGINPERQLIQVYQWMKWTDLSFAHKVAKLDTK